MSLHRSPANDDACTYLLSAVLAARGVQHAAVASNRDRSGNNTQAGLVDLAQHVFEVQSERRRASYQRTHYSAVCSRGIEADRFPRRSSRNVDVPEFLPRIGISDFVSNSSASSSMPSTSQDKWIAEKHRRGEPVPGSKARVLLQWRSQ